MVVNKKTALVTGSSEGGIGFAIAKEFQSRGIHVFATARNPDKVAALARLSNVTILALDVTSQVSIDAAVAAVSEQTGGTLDYLVNNAGAQYCSPTLDIDLEIARKMYDVNVWGAVAMIKAFAPLVIKAKGCIANLASIAGLLRPPFMGLYAGSKSALETISETLKYELKPLGVRVLTVNTGAIQTNLFANAYGATQVPANSFYAPISEDIENRLSGKEMDGQLGKPEGFAKALVGDVVGGASGYDRIVVNGTGLDRLAKAA
ncbi:hypothetical protein SLS62_002977 [Diatrype stigma]|uniref:Short-chain dehydrogenase/reductase SDR n=1 Tax=Diatrype stigma TaxID=117547 RepID=A0AAN9YUK3_9PEZI